MILGDGKDERKKAKKYRYGTAYERMTSPGREALREHILTPQAEKRKAKIVKNPSKIDVLMRYRGGREGFT